jgi:hypothetical protein
MSDLRWVLKADGAPRLGDLPSPRREVRRGEVAMVELAVGIVPLIMHSTVVKILSGIDILQREVINDFTH